MTQANSNQPSGGLGSGPSDVMDRLRKIIDLPNKYLGLIGVISITLSFIITWSTSLIASNHIAYNVIPFTIFRNISGTHFGFVLLATALFAIVYSGWFGYSVNTVLSQPVITTGWMQNCLNGARSVVTKVRNSSFIMPVVWALYLLALIAFWLVKYTWNGSQWVPLYWQNNTIYAFFVAIWLVGLIIGSRPASKFIAKNYIILGLLSLFLTAIYGVMTIIVFSNNGLPWYVIILLFCIASMSLSAANVALVIIFQEEKAAHVKIPASSCVMAILTFWFAQMVSLVMIIGMLHDQSFAEVNSFWMSVALISVILLIPLCGMLVGLIGDRDNFVVVTLFLIVLACAILIIFEVPQQFFLTLIGYRKPLSFSLVVDGEKAIKCDKSHDYEIPNDGKVYFSCVENKPKKVYYGVYVDNYPEKLVEKGSGYIYPKAYCVYGKKELKTSSSKIISHNHTLYCIEKWFSTSSPPKQGARDQCVTRETR